MMSVLFLKIFRSFLENCTSQSSSHNCPSKIKDALCRLSRTCAFVALSDSDGDNGILPTSVAVMVELSGNVTVGPCRSSR